MKRGILAALCIFAAAAGPQTQASGPNAFQALHTFTHNGVPVSLVQAQDGAFYGVTNLRKIFRVTATGSLTIWQPFTGDVISVSELVAGADGNLYGIAITNGLFYFFQLTTSSGEVTVLHQFSADEGFPYGLIAGNDGFLYGIIGATTLRPRGALFRVSLSGALSTVHAFTPEENIGYVVTGPIQGGDGALYFVDRYAGSSAKGALFRCTRAGVLTTVYSFSGGLDGESPELLTQASDGNFYVEHLSGTPALSRITAAGVLTKVHQFSTSEQPAKLVPAPNGVIYGINDGYGPTSSVFKVAPNGAFTTLQQFAIAERADTSLVLSNDALYGVAGEQTNNTAEELGFVFRVPVTGGLTRLREFTNDSAPFGPNRGLVQAPDGTFYGTTTSGGPAGKGTVYKLTNDGALTVLYGFEDPSDGRTPVSLALGGDGVLYGSTEDPSSGSSTLFRLTTSGVFKTLDVGNGRSFDPVQFIISTGRDGAVYGTAGGGNRANGYVFKIAADGGIAKLYDFTGGADGGRPVGLVNATDGNLYGVTSFGGAHRSGTLFRLTLSGSLTIIRDFPFGILSSRPPRVLVQGPDKNLYCAISGEELPHRQHDAGTLVGITLDGADTGFRPVRLDISQLTSGNDGRLYGIFNKPATQYVDAGPGTVFSCTLSGSLTNLYEFRNPSEGTGAGALLHGADNALYGTLLEDGPLGGGAVYELPPKPTGTLRNISTRVAVRSGDDALFAGFIVSGTEPKKVVIRGLGPSLGAAGVSGPLANPTLQLFNASGAQIGANDDWSTEPGISETGLAPTSTREAAIVRTLTPGAYTAILRGKADTTGVGLVEVYDLSGPETPSSALANISSRGLVGTGNDALIAGFIIADQGGGFGKIIARAIGPSLAQAGIQNPLQNPVLQLFDSNGGQVAANDDWRTTSPQEIEETGIPPTADKESAIVLSARAGAYTAVVRGVGDTTGTALVEVYALQ